jgi:hypothetical protein
MGLNLLVQELLVKVWRMWVDLLSAEFDQPAFKVVQPTQAGFIPEQAV